MAYVVIGSHTVTMFVFLAAAAGKLRSRAAFGRFVTSVRAVAPGGAPGIIAASTAGAELLTAALLAAGPASWPGRAGLCLALALLAGFVAVIGRALRRGVRVPCRCFGSSSASLGVPQIVRNVLLALLAGFALVAGPAVRVVDGRGAVVAVVAAAVVTAVLARLDDLTGLFLDGAGRRHSTASPL